MRDEVTLSPKLANIISRDSRRMIWFLLLSLLPVLATVPAWSAEPYSTEPAQLGAGGALPRELADKLDPQGFRLVTESNGLKMGICELFWAKAVTGQEHQAGLKAHYADFETGALVGVIRFLPEADEDFREDNHDQKLKPGYYVMRYALLPTEELRDVVLLSPANADGESGQTLALDEVKRRSRLASGTDDPAVLSLSPPESGTAESPRLRVDEQGTCIVQVELQVKLGKAPARGATLAMVVVTPRKDVGGS